MCGICGIINFEDLPVEDNNLKLMMGELKHRGPDDAGIYIDNNVGLGFVRLSIIDLSQAGHQPMLSDDERYVIVFNGEIFNYLELRKELQVLGFVFKTKTDTEVLLQAYLKWGQNCLHKFNGMWAFVIYDKVEKSIFAARDRFGVKPFYYFKGKDKLIVASEIPAILKIIGHKPLANQAAIFDFLVFNRTDQNEETFFKDIFTLKHGHMLILKNSEVSIRQWYSLKKNLKKPFADEHEYRDMLSDSIQLRLRSDVPVGVCFSGGIDSSSILSLLLKTHVKKEINTFSAVYNKNEIGDESEFINLYKNEVKNMHYVMPSAKSLFDDMHKFILAHAEPIPSTSPYAQFKVMELVKNKATVTIDGQGADEQLGGYHYFFGLYFKELLIKLQLITLIKEIWAYKRIHRSNYALKTFVFFLLPASSRTRIRIKEKGYLYNEYFVKYKSISKTADTIYNSSSLNQALIDHFEYKLEHLLKWEDRNSMYFSIEARVPFLDYRLVERTLSLPPESIIKNGTTKYILREAMKDLLPEKIRSRQDKTGFGTPEAKWFREPVFKEFIYDLLNSGSFAKRKIIDPEKAIKLYEKHIAQKIDVSQEIWKWINLELWYRKFID